MIVSSEIILVSPQADGRNYVIEKHVTDDGREIQVQYLATAEADYEQAMEDRVASLEAQLSLEDSESEEGGE